MAANYLHGPETIEVENGARPVKTVKSAVIGLIGTAPMGMSIRWYSACLRKTQRHLAASSPALPFRRRWMRFMTMVQVPFWSLTSSTRRNIKRRSRMRWLPLTNRQGRPDWRIRLSLMWW